MNVTRREALCASIAIMAGAAFPLSGCKNTPPRDVLLQHIEEEGTSSSGATRLQIPFTDDPETAPTFETYESIDCALVLDAGDLSIEIERIPESSPQLSLSGRYFTSFALPSTDAEEGDNTDFSHIATITFMGQDYTSSGEGKLELSSFTSSTELEFDNYVPAEDDGSDGILLEFEETPGGSFARDTIADICGGLYSLSKYLEDEELGITLADLGILAYEEE